MSAFHETLTVTVKVVQNNMSTVTDNGTDFKWSIEGGCRITAQLLLCVASGNQFSSSVVSASLLCIRVSFSDALAFALTCMLTKSSIGSKRRRMLMLEEMPMKPLGMDALKVPLKSKVNANASH